MHLYSSREIQNNYYRPLRRRYPYSYEDRVINNKDKDGYQEGI